MVGEEMGKRCPFPEGKHLQRVNNGGGAGKINMWCVDR